MEIAPALRFDDQELSRLERLARRVADAAGALCRQGTEPTARNVRVALRGGSPNEIGPALRAWRESTEGIAALKSRQMANPRLPIEIADLCAELWQRASIAAHLEASTSVRSVESESAQAQLTALRDQLKRELVRYGELQAQSARHEAGAKSLGTQLEAAERRERGHLRDLGETRARIAELEATVEQLTEQLPAIQTARHRTKPQARRRPTRSAQQRPKAKNSVKRPRPVLGARSKASAKLKPAKRRLRLKKRAR